MKEKPINQELFDEPFKFEFFQAVRLLEKIFPERMPVGRDALPLKEVTRFRSNPTLDFPSSEIREIKEVSEDYTDEQKIELVINFMGMVGPVGVLPEHYNEITAERVRYRDTALHSFLDIFTHRAVSQFYRAWEKYRFPVQYERGNDEFTQYLFAFLGLGTKGLLGRLDLDDESLIPYGGLIAQKPHSVSALEQILSDYFQINAKIIQFFGQWLELDDESVSKIGLQNNKLGVSTVLGTKVWDSQSKFRVVFGALKFQQFQAFLPNGTAHKSAVSIIKFMTGIEFDFDIQLKLKAKEVPSCILTTRAKRKPMLGWTTFLKSKPFTEDDEQLVLQT